MTFPADNALIQRLLDDKEILKLLKKEQDLDREIQRCTLAWEALVDFRPDSSIGRLEMIVCDQPLTSHCKDMTIDQIRIRYGLETRAAVERLGRTDLVKILCFLYREDYPSNAEFQKIWLDPPAREPNWKQKYATFGPADGETLADRQQRLLNFLKFQPRNS